MTRHIKGTKIYLSGRQFGPDVGSMDDMSSCGHFDADAWQTLIAEQKRVIANIAGVDPSKVSIRLGH